MNGDDEDDGENTQQICFGLFLLQSALVIGFTRLLSICAPFFHQPSVVFEILSGILLGPSVFGHYKQYQDTVFPSDTISILEFIADIGLVFYIFTVGVHLNTEILSKNIKSVWLIALLGLIIPFISAFILLPILSHIFEEGGEGEEGEGEEGEEEGDKSLESQSHSWISVSFLGTSLSVTAFPVLACILADKHLMETNVGVLTLGAAAVEEIFLWLILTIILTFVHTHSLKKLICIFGAISLIIFLLFVLIRPLLSWFVDFVEKSPQGWKWNKSLFALTLVLLLICAWSTEFIGIHPILGSFLCGLIIPRKSLLWLDCSQFSTNIIEMYLLPLYFTVSGLRLDLTIHQSISNLFLALFVVLVFGYVSKFLSGFIAAFCCGLDCRQASAVGIIMNTRGLMELIVLNIGLETGLITNSIFTVMVLMSLVSTFLTSPLLDLVYPEHLRDLTNSGCNNSRTNTIDEEEKEESMELQRSHHRFSIICQHQSELTPYFHLFTFLCPPTPSSQLHLTIVLLSSNPLLLLPTMEDNLENLPTAEVELIPSHHKTPRTHKTSRTSSSSLHERNYSLFFEEYFISIGAQINLKYVNSWTSLSSLNSLFPIEIQELILIPLFIIHDFNYLSQLMSISPYPIGLLTSPSPHLISQQQSITQILILICGSTSDHFILNLLERLCSTNLSLSFTVVITRSQRERNQVIQQKIMILKSMIHDGLLSNVTLRDLSLRSNQRQLHLSSSYHLTISGFLSKQTSPCPSCPSCHHSPLPSAPSAPSVASVGPSSSLSFEDICGEIKDHLHEQIPSGLHLVIYSSLSTEGSLLLMDPNHSV